MPASSDDDIANARGLKAHLRLVRIGRYVFRVIGLRPSTTARFSTNNFHDTWHIVTDREGAWVLARLLWGLAFQRQPGTFVLIDRTHLTPTPFEADAPDVLVLANTDLARLDPDLLRALKKRVRSVPIENTVRVHTFGLSEDDDDEPEYEQRDQMRRIGGMLCYSADAATLRAQARVIHRMKRCSRMDYHYLADVQPWSHPDGEVQVFRDFADMVSAAKVARRAVAGTTSILSTSQRDAIYGETDYRIDLLRAARRKRS